MCRIIALKGQERILAWEWSMGINVKSRTKKCPFVRLVVTRTLNKAIEWWRKVML